jgi:hypothetical protein
MILWYGFLFILKINLFTHIAQAGSWVLDHQVLKKNLECTGYMFKYNSKNFSDIPGRCSFNTRIAGHA